MSKPNKKPVKSTKRTPAAKPCPPVKRSKHGANPIEPLKFPVSANSLGLRVNTPPILNGDAFRRIDNVSAHDLIVVRTDTDRALVFNSASLRRTWIAKAELHKLPRLTPAQTERAHGLLVASLNGFAKAIADRKRNNAAARKRAKRIAAEVQKHGTVTIPSRKVK